MDAPVSFIAADAVIEGNFTAQGEVQIDGTVRGTVRAAACVVGSGGLVEGDIVADEVIIRGKVSGPIRGIHVELQAGAHVEGDIVNTTIAIENGAHIHGSVWHSEDPLTGSNTYQQPRRQETSPALLTNPFWNADEGFRPIKAIKPR